MLARWAGWGALAHAFDEHDPAGRRLHAELIGLLTDTELASARRSTLNAHYTDAGITTAMWRFAIGLGFDGGRVLEPGCGTGVFLATRPDNLVIDATGVEVEPVTARIAALLHPDADIRSEGFEATRLADPVDLVIGNVPFAKVALHDPVHNRGRHSIHNHFLVKALALTRPGGLLVAITSRYTLDSRNPAARRELAALGDFVGAARLPSAAHRAAAGTDVVTDIVVFRRRSDGEAPSHAGPWQASVPLDIDGGVRPLNEWFASEPALVVGRLVAGNGVYGREDLSVELDEPLEPALDAALDRAASLAHQRDLAYRARSSVTSLPSASVAPPGGVPAGAKEGSIHRAGSSFVRVVGGVPQPFQPSPRKDASELVALCDLRDTTIGLLDAQALHVDDARCLALQAELNDRYDRYVERFGPLNRFRLARTGRTDPVTGADLYRRMNPAMGGFDDDPDFRTLLALEDFDPDSQTATKAAIFSRRLLAPAAARYGADTAETSIYETVYHMIQDELKIEMLDEQIVRERAVYDVRCQAILLDLSAKRDSHPELVADHYTFTQTLAKRIVTEGHPGLLAPSARCAGTVAASFNINVLSDPRTRFYLNYRLIPATRTVYVERSPGKPQLILQLRDGRLHTV